MKRARRMTPHALAMIDEIAAVLAVPFPKPSVTPEELARCRRGLARPPRELRAQRDLLEQRVA